MVRDGKGNAGSGKPLGLRLPPNVVVEFKQEAARLGINGSALFMKIWADRQRGEKS